MTTITQNDNFNFFQKAACAAAGTCTTGMITKVVTSNNPLINVALDTLNNTKIPQVQADTFIKTMTVHPALKKSGFKLMEVSSKNAKDVTNSLVRDSFKKIEKLWETKEEKKFFENFKNVFSGYLGKKLGKVVNTVKDGKNAFYHPITNVAVYPKDKPIMLAHEIGHAINSYSSKFAMELINAGRILPKVAMITVPAVAIWKSFKNKNSEDKSFVQKHAGKMVFASFIPMIAEETLASLRAIKAAQKTNIAQNLITGMKKG